MKCKLLSKLCVFTKNLQFGKLVTVMLSMLVASLYLGRFVGGRR